MQSLILFLKGLIIGLGKIIPGVSGSVLAISLGVYEETMKRVEHLFRNLKENIAYLLPLGIGVALSILLGSNLVLYFLEHYYLYTMILFIGLILGTVPGLVKKQNFVMKDWCFIFILFLILYFLSSGIALPEFMPTKSLSTYVYILFLGFLDAVTTIIPGISGTATYMMLGSYNFILKLFSNPFQNIFYLFLFGLGLITGFILVIKFVNYCFRVKAHQTWCCIIAFLLSSVYFLILKVIDSLNSTNILSVFCLIVASFFLVHSLDSLE